MIAEKLAEITVQTSYSKIPEEAVEKAKLCFLDFLGVSLRGSQGESSKKVRNILPPGEESSILGAGKSTSMDASLANGVAAHSMDLDDGHRIAQLHPGCCVIPAALATCESQKKDGKDLITSIVAGYSTAIIIGILANPEHRNKGFHSTGTCGTFGAAAAASKSMDLDLNETVNALGLAGTQAAGLLESDHAGTMGKHLHAGKAAQSGVLSALLAKEGFTGAESILEGKEGFLNATACNYETELKNTTKDHLNELITKPHIMDVYFKKYPVCRHLHSPIDAVVEILSEIKKETGSNKIQDEILNIRVKTYKIAAEHNNYHPNTPESLKQSLPMSIAMAVSDSLDLENIDSNAFKELELSEISNKVEIVFDPKLDNFYPSMRPSEVTMNLKNGKKYVKRVDLPLGEPENPLNKVDIIEKFQKLNPKFDVDVLGVVDYMESLKICDLIEIINEEFKSCIK